MEKICGHKWKTILNIIINRFYLFSFNFQSTRGIFLCWVKSCIDQCNLWGPHLIKITRREFSLNYLKDLDSGIWSPFSLSLLLILWYQTSGILMANIMHNYKITIIAPKLNWRKRKKWQSHHLQSSVWTWLIPANSHLKILQSFHFKWQCFLCLFYKLYKLLCRAMLTLASLQIKGNIYIFTSHYLEKHSSNRWTISYSNQSVCLGIRILNSG